MKKILLVLMAMICIVTGCKDEKKVFTDITTTLGPCVSSSDFGKSDDTILLINNKQQLKQFCVNAPAVNFAKQSLILVKGESCNGIVTIKTNFAENKNASYSLSIHVLQNFTCVVQGWYKCYLIPKISSIQDVSITINYGYF